jgi:hypothetical protein
MYLNHVHINNRMNWKKANDREWWLTGRKRSTLNAGVELIYFLQLNPLALL